MAQDKTKQVLVRVTPDTKEQWEKAADDRGFRGLSGFIRHAASNEIDGRDDGGTAEIDTERLTETVTDAVEDAITDDTDQIARRLSAIEGAISSLREEVSDGGGTVPPEQITEILQKHEDTVGVSEPMTPEEVAQELGVAVSPVRRTLETIDLKSERVQSVEYDDGETRGYYLDV